MDEFKSSYELLGYFRKMFNDIRKDLTENDKEIFVRKYEELLKYDKQQYMESIYKYAVRNMTDLDQKLNCLLGFFEGITFRDIKIDLDYKFLSNLHFSNCSFSNVIFTESIKRFFNTLKSKNDFFFENNSFENIRFSDVEDFHYSDVKINRIGDSPLTTRVNLYVELGRICNASCPFCRNRYFDVSEYNLSKIKRAIKHVKPFVTDVVIGGGEPTLLYPHLVRLKFFLGNDLNAIISSNLSTKPQNIQKLKDLYGYKFLVSRHAINKDENAHIFGFSPEQRENASRNLHYLSRYQSSTISTVCFKNGIDSFDKLMNYINWALEIGYDNILIQTLHSEKSVGTNIIDDDSLYIDTDFIDRAIKYLLDVTPLEAKPLIYSTGNYKLTVLTNGFKTIAFKQYIDPLEFDEKFQTTLKRTFDLSITPEGRIYENFHQTSDEVVINRKVFRKIRKFDKRFHNTVQEAFDLSLPKK